MANEDSFLAGSATRIGGLVPIQLLANDDPVTTDQAPVAPGTKLDQYTVIALNGDGKIVQWASGADAVGILAQPVDTTVTGDANMYGPFFRGGCFNHEALLWPAGVTTLAARKAAFERTPINISNVLK